jgi:hypothetical protein
LLMYESFLLWKTLPPLHIGIVRRQSMSHANLARSLRLTRLVSKAAPKPRDPKRLVAQ